MSLQDQREKAEERPARLQVAWQWALDMLVRGRRNVDRTLVSMVEDVTGADLPTIGSVIHDRYGAALQPAVAGTHRFLEITAGPAGLEVLMLASLSAATQYALQASAFRGSTVANVVVQDPVAVGNVSQWNYGNAQFPGPAFFFTAPRPTPYRVTTGTCGQFGPFIVEHQPAVGLTAVRFFEPSIVLQPSESLVVMCSVANLAMDVSFRVRVPMRSPQAPEGF